MQKKEQPSNTKTSRTRINPVVVYCIVGAVVAFNVVLYFYVMDRLSQLDKLKEDLMQSTKQYDEVPLPDLMKDQLMKDPEFKKNPELLQNPVLLQEHLNKRADKTIEELKRLEKELDEKPKELDEKP
jgi:hypothetical protein